jgi:alpha-amylase
MEQGCFQGAHHLFKIDIMKNKRFICLYFQVHQPYRLGRFRYFDIGRRGGYFDNEKNKAILEKVSEKCYLPATQLLQELVRRYPNRFKCSFSFSGMVLEQFQEMHPKTLSVFQELMSLPGVEALAETYGHSLSALASQKEFEKQVKRHGEMIHSLFHQQPTVLRNTELIYSDTIGKYAAGMGFKGILAEGADRILGWRSPNFLYAASDGSSLGVLLKNYRLSDDIAFRFSQPGWNEGPLTAEKFVHWLNAIPADEPLVNLFMDYETFGEHQWAESGIFDFLQALPEAVFQNSDFQFITPSEVLEQLVPVDQISMPEPVSWADEARDLSAWLGNPLQDDAFESLYRLQSRVESCADEQIQRDWQKLQTSDHFYYMCTKYFADGDVHKYFNPYDSPYEAFVNYMNVLADFELRLQPVGSLTTGPKRSFKAQREAIPHRVQTD